MDISLDEYAKIMAELAAAGENRNGVLARRGFDEASWETIDEFWQDRLSASLEENTLDDDNPASALVSAYTAAYASAQRALAPPISLEQFARMTRLLQASGDLNASLSKVGITLAEYTRASDHWAREMTQDASLKDEFSRVLAGL